MAGEEESDKNKGFKVLGILDVQNTPCAREALLHGSGGSLAAGLLHFLATSRVKRSFDIGFAGFMLTTLGSWFYCRITNAQLRMQQRLIQDGIKNKVMYEGTSLDTVSKPKKQEPCPSCP
ncbi:cytochrome c oxidase assembly protein COX20, mitochondrial [Salvelinus namaycush]|uniref:Cytochrome c oxidase assembly protein COX20, mitochondrial n=1 Tax=Salvelinus namaycush TaxID=8040 RepID=A0A8U0PVE8_SALNM|nr:cytochrome c oxidase protein 20 homolog [Salvelinus alpinus]XP_038831052.1 cytochrome c oxidase assembly protein COX20, mitochondrial [Salvelinus namaycush]